MLRLIVRIPRGVGPRWLRAGPRRACLDAETLTPDIFGVLAGVREDRTCEVKGTRHDTGTMLGFLEATMSFAMKRGDLRDALGAYLRTLLEQEPAGGN